MIHFGFAMNDRQQNVDVKMGSERNFGFVFCSIMTIIALWPVMSGNGPRIWLLLMAALLLAVTLVAPHLLRPLNRLWFRFGLLLGAIVAPIVMALVYFLAFLPIGVLLRIMGKDLLSTRLDPDQTSYWIERKEPPGSMERQF
ncbi:SxtJ family membrane protein [Paracoccus sp. SCSIO 75233]|uniref:SxtJ family membrane protein n=1 Tax=Paracoccus sp. SCSIO 75233 TaxID=3017782 RepID=UPI0022F0D0B2|nr:SxtJ family membrane protein [Paracoccus sp. SCSIO 75233]WBU53904.1 SxtJ family membrane protein [Paracoccus sp. SCSIO 75233]